jgi:hypothetical protein
MQTQPQTAQVVLNSVKLHSVSHVSPTAEVVMTALSQRERLRNFTDISRLKNSLIRDGERIVDEDYSAFWIGMQASGVGRLVFSKKGKQDRFFWHYSMKKVAQAALEGKNVKAERIDASAAQAPSAQPTANTKKVIKLATKKPSTATQMPAAHAQSPERMVLIPIRKDFCLEFSVPSNLTKDEVETIGSVLKRLSA